MHLKCTLLAGVVHGIDGGSAVTVIDHWTGASATALRQAMRLTNEAFAERLGVSARAVAKWRAEPELKPSPSLQQVLDTVLERCDVGTLERFATMTTSPDAGLGDSPAEPLTPTLLHALDWIDEHAGWSPGTAEQRVHRTLSGTATDGCRRPRARRDVPRSDLATAVAQLYPTTAGLSLYSVEVDGRPLRTSILTRDAWIDTALPLGPGTERFTLDYVAALPSGELSAEQADAAVERVVEILVGGARIFNAELYALLDVDISDRRVSGTFGLTDFVPYALTTDLLEDELAHAILGGRGRLGWESLPLRAEGLPTVDAALDLRRRVCVGGALALVAIARPADRVGQPADYLLLIQERSAQVVNGTGSLSVVPKAFHQPLGDYTRDAAISATIEREFEEELLGRSELEAVLSGSFVDPRHLSRLSPPMRALIDGGANLWTTECTGFGINLASGNYEFAGLIAIHDEQWWLDHGGDLRGNWETDGVRRYSSRDHDGIAHLIKDDRWSNEGLFAFLQGLRRLAEIAPDRVSVPTVSMDTRYR